MSHTVYNSFFASWWRQLHG